MPSQIDSNTSSRFVLNPLLVYVADRQLGPTRGGTAITITRDVVQPEMDGVNQGIVGASYKRSEVVQVEFSVVEFSAANMNLMNFNVGASGTTPNFTYTPFANMTMMAAGQYMGSPGLKMYGTFTDTTTPGYFFFLMPNGLITAVPEFAASGEATLKITITSAVSSSTPDATPYTFGRVATLPTEVGGP